MMITRALGKADYDHIVEVMDKWWGGPTSALAHPIFFYELGQAARVIEHDGRIVGFLFGIITGDEPRVGYVHLVGIHPDYRRRGVGRRLYDSFEDTCRSAGCKQLKSITTPGNDASERFHAALGWTSSVADNYAGQGRHRVVFRKALL